MGLVGSTGTKEEGVGPGTVITGPKCSCIKLLVETGSLAVSARVKVIGWGVCMKKGVVKLIEISEVLKVFSVIVEGIVEIMEMLERRSLFPV